MTPYDQDRAKIEEILRVLATLSFQSNEVKDAIVLLQFVLRNLVHAIDVERGET